MEIQLTAARSPDGVIVGVCGKAAPGACQPRFTTKLKMLPVVFANGLRAGLWTMRWMGVWAKRDLPERHWHLGPVAIDAEYQGFGIGTALMIRFCAEMDAAGEVAYLETDKPINVRFYQRCGLDLCRLIRNGVEASRRVKPSIPVTGADGVPIRHELEFELIMR